MGAEDAVAVMHTLAMYAVKIIVVDVLSADITLLVLILEPH